MKTQKPNLSDHDKALQMCWSGLLTDHEKNVCNIIAGAAICNERCQADHYQEFCEIEARYDILTGLQDTFPDTDISVNWEPE